jgi:hypothetical protein
MAVNVFDVTCNTVSCPAGVAKTVLGVLAAANLPLKVTGISLSFDSPLSFNPPAVLELCACTFATNPPGTNSTGVTPTKRDGGRAEVVQATAGKNWTVEPTVITPLRTLAMPQFNGTFEPMGTLGREGVPWTIPALTGFLIRITASANINFSGHLTAEE